MLKTFSSKLLCLWARCIVPWLTEYLSEKATTHNLVFIKLLEVLWFSRFKPHLLRSSSCILFSERMKQAYTLHRCGNFTVWVCSFGRKGSNTGISLNCHDDFDKHVRDHGRKNSNSRPISINYSFTFFIYWVAHPNQKRVVTNTGCCEANLTDYRRIRTQYKVE